MLEFFTKIAATHETPTGSYSTETGLWVEGVSASTTIAIIAPQPAPGRMLQLLPEGEREYSHLMTWSETAFSLGDKITVAGRTYRVTLVNEWRDDGNYTQVLMREEQ